MVLDIFELRPILENERALLTQLQESDFSNLVDLSLKNEWFGGVKELIAQSIH